MACGQCSLVAYVATECILSVAQRNRVVELNGTINLDQPVVKSFDRDKYVFPGLNCISQLSMVLLAAAMYKVLNKINIKFNTINVPYL